MPRPFFHAVRCTSFLVFVIGVIPFGACSFRKLTDTPQQQIEPRRTAVNINTADRPLLESLPNVGPVLAEKIIEHRTRYGPFRKVEHLLLIEGVSEKRFQAMLPMITAN